MPGMTIDDVLKNNLAYPTVGEPVYYIAARATVRNARDTIERVQLWWWLDGQDHQEVDERIIDVEYDEFDSAYITAVSYDTLRGLLEVPPTAVRAKLEDLIDAGLVR